MTKPIMGTTAGATQLRLKFTGTGLGTNVDQSVSTLVAANTRYVDTSALLTQANRRLYRQGRMYMVRVGFLKPGVEAGATVSVIPNTWMSRKAWVESRKAYLKAMRDSGVKKTGRWSDFRVNYDQAQYLGNGSLQYTFVGLSGSSSTDLERRTSQVAGDSGTSEGSTTSVYQFHVLGDTTFSNSDGATASFGIIDEYDMAEDVVVDDPADSGVTAPYSELNSDSAMANFNQEVAIEVGDYPGYDSDQFDVGRTVEYQLKQQATDSIPPVTPWIAAPLGLLKITGYGADALAADTEMYIEVMAGNYKGVMSEPI